MENQIYYTQRKEICQKNFILASRKHKLLGSLRLATFISIGLVGYFFWGTAIGIISCVLFFVIFLYLVHLSVDTKYRRDKQKKLIEMNEEELNVLNGNWLHFKEGSEYKDPGHAFAHDMDLFGKKSIFQLLNRTVSRKGSNLLAKQLLEGVEDTTLANHAISDLSMQADWCQEFLVEGMVFKEETLEKEFQQIKTIVSPESKISSFIRIGIPVLSITFTLLLAFDQISDVFFGIYLVCVFALIGRNLKKANQITVKVTSFSSQVKMFQKQLELYKNVSIHSELFNENRKSLFSNQDNLLNSLKELEKIQSRMDSRMNLVVGVLLNFFLAWDYLVLYQWEKWRTRNESHLDQWENQLAQIEVWISGAVYKFNFPETTFAKFSENEEINITGMGHPFVAKAKCVLNDLKIAEEEHFVIITGPNMAGKSTFLRSIGLAFICANSGFPVFAEMCEIPNLKLYSSMRTTDDLTVESSYFHAELTRLRFIMDAIERGEKVFVILDEILKGTNSKDKEIGSAKFLEKLRRLNTKGIIATHDLSLCKLAEGNAEGNGSFRNMFFDSTISGEQLSFDYKIRPGICQNMNASFLLKKMKLVDA